MRKDLHTHRTDLAEQLQEYRRLSAFSSEIERIDDVDELILFGLEALLKILRFDTAVFGEVLGDELLFTRIRGKPTFNLSAGMNKPVSLLSGAHGEAVRTGFHVYVDKYNDCDRKVPDGSRAGLQNLLIFPVRVAGRVTSTVSFTTTRHREGPSEEKIRIAKMFVSRLENALERVFHINQIEASRDATFSILGRALEFRDSETRGHTDRVISLTRAMSARLNLAPIQQRNFLWGAYLHDIGKLGIPDNILQKPGPLTPLEFDTIKQHTLFGLKMLDGINFLTEETLGIILSHHERWDGTGYPKGLAGEDIPFLARAFALIDVYDALTHERLYKAAWAHDRAVEEILKSAGTHFDPSLTGLFVSVVDSLHSNE